jgi:hypothetical protein
MPIVTGSSDEAFPRFASLSCPDDDTHKLCFHQTTTTTTAAASSADNPFVQLEFISMNDGHHAYDKVLQMANDENPYLMTTLRDAVDYSVTNYKRRAFWDGPFPNIKELLAARGMVTSSSMACQSNDENDW